MNEEAVRQARHKALRAVLKFSVGDNRRTVVFREVMLNALVEGIVGNCDLARPPVNLVEFNAGPAPGGRKAKN